MQNWNQLYWSTTFYFMKTRMESFNPALLAKQGWRIITKPNSLAARVLKCKYFRNSSFLEVSYKRNDSFIWRSLMWGKDLLRTRIRWRVGNGQCISALYNRWIPSNSTPRIQNKGNANEDFLVANLIDDNK